MTRLVGAVVALVLTGCYETPKPNCAFLCGPGDSCPQGYLCGDDRVCHKVLPGNHLAECDETFRLDAAVDAPADAPAVDAAIDSPLPVDAPIDAREIDAPPDAHEIDAPPDAPPPIDAPPPDIDSGP